MDEIIPFLIFVAFTIFEAIRGRKKKNRQKKAAALPKQESLPIKDTKSLDSNDFLNNFISSLQFSEEETVIEDEEIFDDVIHEEPIITESSKTFREFEELEEITLKKNDLILDHRKEISSSFKAVPLKLLSLKSLQMNYIPISSSAEKKAIDFSLNSKKAVKKAIIASLVFSRPRAYDSNFDSSNII
tara:strand:- start:90 stop:650 length:561 start_codon:yes stop_codon:yes gene_type:complete